MVLFLATRDNDDLPLTPFRHGGGSHLELQ
jgi:hypothetical protein